MAAGPALAGLGVRLKTHRGDTVGFFIGVLRSQTQQWSVCAIARSPELVTPRLGYSFVWPMSAGVSRPLGGVPFVCAQEMLRLLENLIPNCRKPWSPGHHVA